MVIGLQVLNLLRSSLFLGIQICRNRFYFAGSGRLFFRIQLQQPVRFFAKMSLILLFQESEAIFILFFFVSLQYLFRCCSKEVSSMSILLYVPYLKIRSSMLSHDYAFVFFSSSSMTFRISSFSTVILFPVSQLTSLLAAKCSYIQMRFASRISYSSDKICIFSINFMSCSSVAQS